MSGQVAVERPTHDVSTALAVGRTLVAALAEGDWNQVAACLHPDLHLRGLTPGKFNRAKGRMAIARAIDIFKLWFYEENDYLTGVLACDATPYGPDGDYRLSYSFAAKSPVMVRHYMEQGLPAVPPDADWVVEQEAYYRVKDGRVSWMIILCGGYCPVRPAR